MKVINFDVNRMLGDLGGENVAFQRSEIRWRRTDIAQVVLMPASGVLHQLVDAPARVRVDDMFGAGCIKHVCGQDPVARRFTCGRTRIFLAVPPKLMDVSS